MLRETVYILWATFFCGIISCTSHNKGYTDTISCNTIKLKSQVLNDSFIFAKPDKLFLYDSILIVSDVRLGNNLFYVFNTSDGHFLKSGGMKGEGPGEVIIPDNSHLRNDGILSYWDINKSKLVQYNVKHLLCDSAYVIEIPLERTRISYNSLLDVIDLNGTFIYNGNTERHLGIYSSTNYVDAPQLPNIPSMELCRAIMNRGYWEASPDGHKLVRITYIGGIVQCYEIYGNAIKEEWSKLFFPPVYKIVDGAVPVWITWKQESQIGFENLYVTNRYIYLLLNGKTARDKPFSNEVLVMDWNGTIVNKYQLNCFVKSIAVDEKNEIMYAITCGLDEDAKIVSFDLNK